MSEQIGKKASGMITISFIVLCLCYMVPNYAQYQVSPLGTVIMERYGIGLSQLSTLFSAPMIPAIFLSLIGGLLIDKFGAKGVIGCGLILGTVGCAWRIFCANFTPLFISTMLTGFTACFITAGCGKIIANLYGPENVPGKMGVLMACSTGAMTIANFTTAYFQSVTSAFTVAAIFAAVATVLWFVFEKNPKGAQEQVDATAGTPSMGQCLKVTLKSRGVWFASVALFFIMSANVVIGSFLPTALASRGVSPTIAGTMAACVTIGNLLGCFVAPFCIRMIHSQKKVLICFGIIAAIGLCFAWQIPNMIFLAVALLLTGVFMGGMIPTLMGLPVQFAEVGPTYAGTAGGVIGTIQILGAVLVPSYVLTPIANGNFVTLFILAGVCMVCASICSAAIKGIK